MSEDRFMHDVSRGKRPLKFSINYTLLPSLFAFDDDVNQETGRTREFKPEEARLVQFGKFAFMAVKLVCSCS